MDDCHLDAERFHRELGPTVHSVDLAAPSTAASGPEAVSEQLRSAPVEASQPFDAVAVQCWSDEVRSETGFGVTACLGVSDLLSSGRPAACMGDLPTLVALVVANVLTGTSQYTEVDAPDEQRGGLVLSNGGELDRRLADGTETQCANQFFSGHLGRGLAWRGRLRPGPAALVGFTPTTTGWRLVTVDGMILATDLADFPVPHGFFAGARPAPALWSSLVEAGSPHHMAVAGRKISDAATQRRSGVYSSAWSTSGSTEPGPCTV